MLFLALVIVLLAACDNAAEQPAPPATATPAPTPTMAIAEVEGMRTFVIVPAESKAFYVMQEEFFQDALAKYNIPIGQGETVGSTDEIEGMLQLDLETATLGANQFTVNLPSLETDQRLRDEWIRENGLESNRYPVATFVATEIRNPPADYQEGSEATFQLAGDMTIREITQPVVFDVTAILEGNTIRGVAEAPMTLTSFDIEPPSFIGTLTVKDDFVVRIEFTAQEQ
jgi:polyisoprenoid-binding protein YceI